jgi:O-antigen/teichoic acid export membrane protein
VIGAAQGGIIKRSLGNASLLLTGKASAGLMQLATFALAARGLGIEDFGYLSMLIAQVLLLTGLATFESNQAVIRYGVDHLATHNAPGFQALIKAGTALDLAAATLAAAAALILPPILGPSIGWDARIIFYAQLIAPLAYANAISTQKGMLRLFGRFGLLSWHAVITPGGRMLGFLAAWSVDADLLVYLLIWVLAGWLGAAAAFILAWREARRRRLLEGMTASFRGLSALNPGVWRFTLYSNLHTSVALIPSQGSVFIVGALIGPGSAGLFRIARDIGTALSKPVDLINQTLYPDIARLVRSGQWPRLARTAVRAGLIAGLAGGLVMITVALVGRPLIHLLFGVEFGAAAPLLLLLALATTIRVVAFAADPILYALGKPQVALFIAISTTLLFLAAMVWRIPSDGLMAAGWAYLAMNIAGALLSIGVAWLFLSRARSTEPSPSGP